MSIEDIKQIMDGFDPAALLPDLSTLEGKAELICRIAVLVGPVLLLALGRLVLVLPNPDTLLLTPFGITPNSFVTGDYYPLLTNPGQ